MWLVHPRLLPGLPGMPRVTYVCVCNSFRRRTCACSLCMCMCARMHTCLWNYACVRLLNANWNCSAPHRQMSLQVNCQLRMLQQLYTQFLRTWIFQSNLHLEYNIEWFHQPFRKTCNRLNETNILKQTTHRWKRQIQCWIECAFNSQIYTIQQLNLSIIGFTRL